MMIPCIPVTNLRMKQKKRNRKNKNTGMRSNPPVTPYNIQDVSSSSSFLTVWRGGLAGASSVTLPFPVASFLRSRESRTHRPSISLFVDSTCAKSGRLGERGRSQGCSSKALNVGLFRGTLFKLHQSFLDDGVPLTDERLRCFGELLR